MADDICLTWHVNNRQVKILVRNRQRTMIQIWIRVHSWFRVKVSTSKIRNTQCFSTRSSTTKLEIAYRLLVSTVTVNHKAPQNSWLGMKKYIEIHLCSPHYFWGKVRAHLISPGNRHLGSFVNLMRCSSKRPCSAKLFLLPRLWIFHL